MKTKMSWEVLAGFAGMFFIIKYLLGGAFGDAFVIGGVIMAVFSYIEYKKFKKTEKKD